MCALIAGVAYLYCMPRELRQFPAFLDFKNTRVFFHLQMVAFVKANAVNFH
jgi:hypothetical protein